MQTKNTWTVHEQWRRIRQSLIKSYYQLAGLDPSAQFTAKPIHLHCFCQLLTDYLALGNFCVYQKQLEQYEQQYSETNKTSRVYFSLVNKTQTTLDIIDYTLKTLHLNPKTIPRSQLSELGEVMSDLLELEDKLFQLTERAKPGYSLKSL